MTHTIALFVVAFAVAPILWVFAPSWKSKAQRAHERLFRHNFQSHPERKNWTAEQWNEHAAKRHQP